MSLSRIQSLLTPNNEAPKLLNRLSTSPKEISQPKMKADSLSFVSPSEVKSSVLPKLNFVGEVSQNVPKNGIPLNSVSFFRSSGTNSTSRLDLPSRPEGSLTGSQFISSTFGLNPAKREELILSEIKKGNVPEFARQMKEINISGTGKDGKIHNVKMNVMPDYLAIGSDQDFVRIPMNPLTAQKIADQTGTVLPTSKIVDEIYNQAEVKLTPQPMPPIGTKMMSSQYYQQHQQLIDNQMKEKGVKIGVMIAGQKKDVVLSNKLEEKPDRVAIYGWHQGVGKPIQPTSTVHENTYADYSHGVRLISNKVIVDGISRNLADVLKDPVLASLVSKEGPLVNTRIKI